MSQIIQILNFEEGFKPRAYIDSEGYPTIGTGFLIGPKGSPVTNYTFTLSKNVSDVWLQELVDVKTAEMRANPAIYAALKQCNPARSDMLVSMAYQLGTNGLAGFKNTLSMIAVGNFTGAANGMMNSLWARQTKNRALRHADVMRTGSYDIYKGLI
ncbi:glycoside hydrolase family protein [Pantoea sp. DY-15]|uniref:glycoside hydrolase family protein n=1 Tax=Pantoea sp. DY-15 TaxID=2871489 RepID=UPI001C96AA69|nr:glycoside hydrolase family protein [Pantoea sp. DY-15]MBY4887722.1 glycoside hydrolase family protein [Pantoea sp. DY-15]